MKSADQKRPLKVFLCHAHADRDPVRALYTRLTNDGVDAWLDKEKLLPGQDWELEIKKAVREADVVVVCLSKKFNQAGFRQKEVRLALDTAMEKPEGEIFIIPARLEECDNLESLRKWHWVDLFKENGYFQLLSAFGQFSTQSSNTQKNIKLEDNLQSDNVIETQKAISLRIRGDIEDSTIIIGNNNTITKKSERIRFFVTLSEYLDRPTSEFPKKVDFDNGLVYFPSDYFEKINSLIVKNEKCLLLGNSAAGKTVLAIAFGKMLQDEQGFVVQYGNASRALDGDGRLWYHHVMESDVEKTIFIIDNCHLAVDEVNEFCFQIDANAPKFTKIILISRPPAKGKRDSSPMIGDFYDLFFDSTIDVQPQKIYRGVLDQFESYCLQLNPSYYVPLKYDKAEVLKQQHSFSLITSKSRLNAWRQTGGKLSEVTNELTYKLLSDKYLSKAEVSLIALCGLWQFEIPIHSAYVDNNLPQEDINYLFSINLISYEIIPNYGKNYYLLLHPGEAKEIFETHIFMQWGIVNEALILREIEDHLFEYLVEGPQNYQSVYDALFRYGHKNLEQTFLIKDDLQKAAAKRFLGGRLSDVSRYLFALSKINPDLAKNMLADFINDYDLVNFRKRLTDQNIHNFQFSIYHFYRVDNDFIRKVVIAFESQYLANKIQDDSFYNLSWLVRTLAKISPEKTTDTLNNIPMENLISMAIRSNVRDVERFINHCTRFNVWGNRLSQFGDLLSKKTNIFSTYDIKDLQVLHDILRVLRKVSPSLADNYRSNYYFEMRIDDIANLLNRSTLSQVAYNLEKSKYLWGEGYKIFVDNYLPKKLAESELGEINKFLLAIKDKDEQNFYFVVENLNVLLLKGELKEKLILSNISDFSIFVELTSGGLDFVSLRECCRIINSQNRTNEMLVVSLENLVHILWTIVHIGEIDRLTLVDDFFLINRITSSWQVNVVWSLELLGVCLLIDVNYRNYLMNVELSEDDKLMLMRWLIYAVNHKLLFPFLLVVKGLREVAPDIAEEAFLFLINKSDSVSWVDDSFDAAFTRYSQKIMGESRLWFSDLIFRDTISSVDKLVAKANDLINDSSLDK